VFELPGGQRDFPHCGCGPPCNTRRWSLGASVSSTSFHCFFLVRSPVYIVWVLYLTVAVCQLFNNWLGNTSAARYEGSVYTLHMFTGCIDEPLTPVYKMIHHVHGSYRRFVNTVCEYRRENRRRTNSVDFGGNASEPETSRPVQNAFVYLPNLHFAPPLGVIPSEFCRDLLHHKTELSYGVVSVILCIAVLVQRWFVTDRRTHDDSI